MISVPVKQVSFAVQHRAYSIRTKQPFKIYEVNIFISCCGFMGNFIPVVNCPPVKPV